MINSNVQKIHSFSVGMPIPYMLFTKDERNDKMNVNPDTMNFIYVYAGYQYHQIPNVDTNGFWMISIFVTSERDKIYSQLQLHYSKGNYFIS
jgi:hypothetical protein